MKEQSLEIVSDTRREMIAAEFMTVEQEQMVRDALISGASKQEADVLMAIARARRLNPLLRRSISCADGIAQSSARYGRLRYRSMGFVR